MSVLKILFLPSPRHIASPPSQAEGNFSWIKLSSLEGLTGTLTITTSFGAAKLYCFYDNAIYYSPELQHRAGQCLPQDRDRVIAHNKAFPPSPNSHHIQKHSCVEAARWNFSSLMTCYVLRFIHALAASSFRRYATRWKVADSIPDEVTGFFF
jgi:hypothetical protein